MGKIDAKDKVLIEHYREKAYSSRKLLKDFPDKNWSRSGLDYLLKKIDSGESIERKPGSGRPRTVRTDENINVIDELSSSQEKTPNTHLSQREISNFTEINRSSVQRAIAKDLKKKAFRRVKTPQLNANQRQRRAGCAKPHPL